MNVFFLISVFVIGLQASLASGFSNDDKAFHSFDWASRNLLALNTEIPSHPGYGFNKSSFTNTEFGINSKKAFAQVDPNQAFDPFIDHGDFEDNITEEEALSFFQHGRSISVIMTAGYEGVTFTMRNIYGDSPFFVGLNISFFIDFHIAFQVSGTFPTGHYNSLWNTTWQFFNYGLDMKYYLYKQYVNEEQKPLNPYLVAGPFVFNVQTSLPEVQDGQIPIIQSPTGDLSRQERDLGTQIEWDLGLKTGLGLEINLLDPIFVSVEVTHLYTNFPITENRDLSKTNYPPLPQPNDNQSPLYRLQYPQRPEVRGYRFHGDLFQIMAQVGINF